jgi:uncharacterized membrane protein YdjX (TVP38/TMEM64 family)
MSTKKKLFIAASVAVVVAVLWATGALSEWSDAERLHSLVERAGPFGPLVFILVSMLLFSVFLLGPPVWASATIWPLPLAILYCATAAIAASVLSYGFARLLGQSWAQERVPDKLRRYEERLEARPFLTVLTLRILLWANPLVDLLVGVSRVPVSRYLLATIVGLIPTTAIQVFIGMKGIEIAGDIPGWLWAVLFVLAALGLLLRRRLRGSAPDS